MEEKKTQRGEWGSQMEFILACIGYAVGLGNVWRFPYLCFKNGGGAFLIPYVISLLVAGLPMFYLELCLGQFSSLGPNCIFGKIAPVMQGIGWAMALMSLFVCLYYNMIIAWVLYYLGMSFRRSVPWSSCFADFTTENCYSNLDDNGCKIKLNDTTARFFNKSCISGEDATAMNIMGLLGNMSQTSPSEEFFERYVLNMNYEGLENLGQIQWQLVVCLGVAWLIVFFCLIKGIQSTGKVVYFTATFPYLVLFILLIRGITLDGALDGIVFYLKPNMKRLLDITVWKDAAVQIFFSLSTAYGGLLTLSSYNKFHNNCHRDALIVAFMNCGTSFFAGFAVFSIAGFMAHDLGVPVGEVVRSGTGLAFIAYPEAIVRMLVAPLWSILFFFMLLTLGLDSQFTFLETVTTCLMDQFTSLRPWKTWVILTTCTLCFIAGLPFCTQGGMYVVTLLDDYSASYSMIVIALFEVVTVFHIYGVKNFIIDIQMMLGQRNDRFGFIMGPTGWYFKVTLTVMAPLFLVTILICSFALYKPSKYGKYTFHGAGETVGWIISVSGIIVIAVFAIYKIVQNRLQNEPLSKLLQPTPDWCPAHKRGKAEIAKEMDILPSMITPGSNEEGPTRF